MFCELLTATVLCYVEPQFDITASVFDSRFPQETVAAALHSPLLTTPATKRPRNDTRKPKNTKRVLKDSVDNVQTASIVRPTPPKKRDLFEILFGRKKPSSEIPAGVDISQSGYKAVYNAAKKHGVDTNLALRIAKQESGGRCNARSHANAKGVMQVIPGTAKLHGVRSSDRLYDCKVGAEAGVKEIKRLHRMMNGDERKILIGYNCGPGCLKRKNLPKETTNYIARIMR